MCIRDRFKLLEAGIESAADICEMGEEGYKTAMFAVVSEEEAEMNYKRAEEAHMATQAIVAALGGSGATTNAVTPPSAAEIPRADLAHLFGSQDACACAHCRSVFGPAAYFTQVLRLLDTLSHPDSNPTGSGLDVLFAIRPDLQKIGLCCANSDTPMPYLDAVNEVLEDQVSRVNLSFRDANDPSPGGLTLDPPGAPRTRSPIVPQDAADLVPVITQRPEAELRASPEYTWYPAYRAMAAPSPIRYPFHLCLLYTSPSPRDRTRSRMPSSA